MTKYIRLWGRFHGVDRHAPATLDGVICRPVELHLLELIRSDALLLHRAEQRLATYDILLTSQFHAFMGSKNGKMRLNMYKYLSIINWINW